jgi:hypothetical protein
VRAPSCASERSAASRCRLVVEAENITRRHVFFLHHELSGRQVDVLLAGGLINWMREELVAGGPGFSGSEASLGGD